MDMDMTPSLPHIEEDALVMVDPNVVLDDPDYFWRKYYTKLVSTGEERAYPNDVEEQAADSEDHVEKELEIWADPRVDQLMKELEERTRKKQPLYKRVGKDEPTELVTSPFIPSFILNPSPTPSNADSCASSTRSDRCNSVSPPAMINPFYTPQAPTRGRGHRSRTSKVRLASFSFYQRLPPPSGAQSTVCTYCVREGQTWEDSSTHCFQNVLTQTIVCPLWLSRYP